jgi:hypothetical protein
MQRAAAQSEATAVEADPQLVYPIGMMMLLLAAFSVPFHLAKQSQIIAMICVGTNPDQYYQHRDDDQI